MFHGQEGDEVTGEKTMRRMTKLMDEVEVMQVMAMLEV